MELIGNIALSLIAAYVVGSIPFGLVIVWIARGKDLRQIESGRTGGTNAMRAAGFLAGLFTAIFDILKGSAAVWIAAALLPELVWVQAASGLLAILGHNYSVFLIESHSSGIRLRGGAGGAPAFGATLALYPPAALIIFPLALLVYVLIGYASVTTMSIAFFATMIFVVRAIQGVSPWIYVGFGLSALAAVLWALRPNLKRLREGTERVVGLRAYLKKLKNAGIGEKRNATVKTSRPHGKHI
ncbi:MAG: glycerol-3-phosphate acyltransferase [Bellilinea sp.]|jgi:glycerol-3-phosphate acyltransferase PlsY